MSDRISDAVTHDVDAVVMAGSGERVSFGQLEANARRLAHLLHQRGFRAGGHLAFLLDNNPRLFEVVWAAQRSGLLYTPINWHLGAEEAGYIVEDCEATAFVSTARLKSLLDRLGAHLGRVSTKLVVDGDVDGFEPHDEAIASMPETALTDEAEGAYMFYSSGTTGRPKGIVPQLSGRAFGTGGTIDPLVRGLYGFEAGMVYLCPAPLYHAAPLAWSMAAQRVGGTVVVMERFDAEDALRAIERYRVTHAQFVPTHFVRMLKLDNDTRARYDTSSLRTVIHAAAPCPIETKHQMLSWWGPIIHEYYAGSEGNGFCAVGPDEWLARPGTVGRAVLGTVHITNDGGEEVRPGTIGQIWFEGTTRFEYHNDPTKTAEAFNDRGWSTLGDVGYVDDDGYLFLTDRISHMIISGGVNVYPQEIEDVLVVHPEVADAAVIGVPDEEMGESVMAVIQPSDSGADTNALVDALRAHCRDRLAGYKCPHEYRFTDALPRLPTGKLLKRKLREEFGGSSAASVVTGRASKPT